MKIDLHVDQKQEMNFVWPYAIHEQKDTQLHDRKVFMFSVTNLKAIPI